MENGLPITRNNFCEIAALAYASVMSGLILQEENVQGFNEFGISISPFQMVLVVFFIMLGIWAACSLLRTKIP